MKKIIGFGDSFVFGTELADNPDGSKSWIAQAARDLGCSYSTNAMPGCGNDRIAQQVYSYYSNNTSNNTLAVINWTWVARWDFYLTERKIWITLGPTCVPEKLKWIMLRKDAQEMIDFYNRRVLVLQNKFRNLQTILAVQTYLKSKNIASVQTYMDYELLNQGEHAPDYVQELQALVKPELTLFEGENFVDWSRKNGFQVTDPGLHPLEQAHAAACELWVDTYAQILKV